MAGQAPESGYPGGPLLGMKAPRLIAVISPPGYKASCRAMENLVLAIIVFILTHNIAAIRPLRAALAAGLGERTFRVSYSLLSLAVLAWMFAAYSGAPYVELWEKTEWTRWIPVHVMPFSSILLTAGLASPNPLSLSPAPGGYDPARPGIVAVTRHPLMWALILWAGSHIPANGDAASLILFGLILALALTGPPSIDAKRRRTLGEAEWRRLAAGTSSIPLAAALTGGLRPNARDVGYGSIAAGLALYAAMLWAHEHLFGVSPPL